MEGTPQNRDGQQIEPRASEKGLDASIVFGQNRHFAYVYKKTEKLVTAIYLITDFIKDNEPLKWKIREGALALLGLNLDWTTVSLAERRDLLKEYKALALEIVSLSGVACHAGLVSEMNFRILSREFGALVETMVKDENRVASEETVMLDPGFFEAGEPLSLKRNPEAASETPAPSKGQPSRTSISAAPVAEAPRPERKHEYLPIRDAEAKTAKRPESKDSKDSRQAIIIKLLSKKGGLGIKDFAEGIKGVSEKTIQRELLAMVASGVLKKEGERRWSTYSLAS